MKAKSAHIHRAVQQELREASTQLQLFNPLPEAQEAAEVCLTDYNKLT